jgi:16S rRNA processing protein RimM
MADNESNDLILVGVIGRAHGVKGEVKVVPETDDPRRFAGFKGAIAKDRSGLRELAFTSVRIQTTGKGLTPIVQIEGVSSREEAEALRGLGLFVPPSALPLKEDEYFLHDLIGLDVVDEKGHVLGRVEDVLDLPAASTLLVSRGEGGDVLIPLVEEFVAEIGADRISVRLVEGLID